MKRSVVYRSFKEIYRSSSQHSIKDKSAYFIVNNQSRVRKTSWYQEQQLKQPPMDENNESYEFSYKNLNEKDALNNLRNIEKQHDKENYLETYNYNNKRGCGNNNDDTNCASITHGEGYYNDYVVRIQVERNNSSMHDFKEKQTEPNPRIPVDGKNQNNKFLFATYNQYPLHFNNYKTSGNTNHERVQHVAVDDGEINGEEEDNINSETKSTAVADVLVNKHSQTKCKINEDPDNNKYKKVNITTEDTQAIATTNQNDIKHLNQQHLVKGLDEQILHGQQISVHNLLDVAGENLCVGPMGALCDMAALSKLDRSPFGDLKDYTQETQDFLAKKYYHPLYAHGVCRWPGCELALDDMAVFVKHLKTEHCLDDRSTAQARVQMQVVSQLEMHLQKERDRLQAMMHHLYLTKHFVMPEETQVQENMSHIRYKNAGRSDSTTPDLNKTNNNNSNDDSDGAIDLQSLLINSGNISATRKRICDKSPLALAGGLPYMLERAGLDVQQEIQRNREFYKNADVRPPFTYASLIRQSIIESPDKQLTLNEIYNWFQNTFCYFRRNAATWKNAIRTNLSLHKCFVRYEDDFGSFWMVDDSEFVKRRHLSRGRPRKYEPSSSPNSNSQQFGSTIASATSSDVVDGDSVVNDTIVTTSPGSSTAGSSAGPRCASRGSNLYHRSGNKSDGSENNGGNDDYDICEVSQRSPAGYQTHIHSGRRQYCGSKQHPHLQGSIIGIAIKRNVNSRIDHNRIENRTNVVGGVVTTENNPGVGGIGGIGSVGSLDVDNHNGHANIANTGVETEDLSGYDFHTQNLPSDAIFNSPTGSKSNNGRYSPNLQNMWAFGSSLSDEVTSAEFACINNDRYRNFVAGLHLQSLTRRHHFHQHKPASQHMHPKTQQQNSLRSQQHNVRSLHETHGYHIYHTKHDEQYQDHPPGQDIFGVNAILSNTDKYLSHNIESRNEDDPFKQETFTPRQQHFAIKHHLYNSRSDLSADEITNHVYINHHNPQEIDVKYTPPYKTQCNFETQNLNKSDINSNKRSAEGIHSNKYSNAAEEDSSIVDCDREGIQPKRKKSNMSSINYSEIEIKAENESDLKNVDIPLRTKSY